MGEINISRERFIKLFDALPELICSKCPARKICDEDGSNDICEDIIIKYLQSDDDGWISTAERMPEDDLPENSDRLEVKILTCRAGFARSVRVRKRTRSITGVWRWADSALDPTHWMPLPEPPKVNKRKGKL